MQQWRLVSFRQSFGLYILVEDGIKRLIPAHSVKSFQGCGGWMWQFWCCGRPTIKRATTAYARLVPLLRRSDPPARRRSAQNSKRRRELLTKPPKRQHDTPAWQAAIEALILVAEHGGPTMLPRIGVMSALNLHSNKKPPEGGLSVTQSGG